MVVISLVVAVGFTLRGWKKEKPAALFIQALERLDKCSRSFLLTACLAYEQRHLSLNTAVMKVIHFNGASFQTPVIKACSALDWEVVETL